MADDNSPYLTIMCLTCNIFQLILGF